jgi:hypothetical protein
MRSTNSCLREPQPIAETGQNNHNHIENETATQVAPISRDFSICPYGHS